MIGTSLKVTDLLGLFFECTPSDGAIRLVIIDNLLKLLLKLFILEKDNSFIKFALTALFRNFKDISGICKECASG